jgi:hypothetical protein
MARCDAKNIRDVSRALQPFRRDMPIFRRDLRVAADNWLIPEKQAGELERDDRHIMCGNVAAVNG